MEIIRIAEQPIRPTPPGVKARPLADWPAVNVMNLLLSPGQEVPTHVTPVDVLFHVIEGKGKVTIGAEIAEVTAGDTVVSPAHIRVRPNQRRKAQLILALGFCLYL